MSIRTMYSYKFSDHGTLILKETIRFFKYLNDGLFEDLEFKLNREKRLRMDIYKHKDTLLKWIVSCQTAQQLDVFTKLVREFDAPRLCDKVAPLEIELVKTELSDAIVEQRIIIAGKRKPMRVTNHCLLIPNEPAVFLLN